MDKCTNATKNLYIMGMCFLAFRFRVLKGLVLFGLVVAFLQSPLWAAGLVKQNIDTTDAMTTLANYDRGFYTPQVLHLKPSGGKPIEKPYSKLLHLRAEISEFSSNAWLGIDTTGGKKDTTRGVSQDLTEDALNVLQKTFDNIRDFGGHVIVRICYDPWYNGRSNVTPDHKWVLQHVKQLAPVLSKNTDVIVALEMGMHGAYGEMHSDTNITYDRVSEAVNLMLRNTPPELKILTRTGNYSAKVLGFDDWGKDFYIEGDTFQEIAKAKGDTMYRVGMFNDGYLGTQYDYGTWGADCKTSICREEGVAWLEKYGINTPYGGEALTTAAGYQVINTPEFLSYEGFRTHTSYLNIQWNNNLIDSWKKSLFTKKDFDYDPAKVDSLTGFKYINDHLGYRFVLRESWLSDTVGADGVFRAKLRIQNVGFGNLTRKMKASLYVHGMANFGLLDTIAALNIDKPLDSVDFMKVYSRKIEIKGADTVMTFDGNNEIAFEVNLGTYEDWDGIRLDAYLKICSDTKPDDCIHFANDVSLMESVYGPENIYIGSFVMDSRVKSSAIPYMRPSGSVQKKNAPFVQRERHNVIIRDGEKRYKANGVTSR